STVFAAIPSARAVCRIVWPRAMQPRMSNSRPVSVGIVGSGECAHFSSALAYRQLVTIRPCATAFKVGVSPVVTSVLDTTGLPGRSVGAPERQRSQAARGYQGYG